MAKRKANKNGGKENKREKCEEVPEQEDDCKKEVKENEPESEERYIPEIKLKTCTPGAIKDLLTAIVEKYHQFLEGMQVKGYSDDSKGTIAIMSSEEMYEDHLYEQLMYHMRRNHGVRKVILDVIEEKYGRTRDFNVHWSEVLMERNKRFKKYNMNKSYKSTAIGELLDEIFCTYEMEKFSRVAD